MRYLKKKELELFLEKVPEHPKPTPYLEQYTLPAKVAAEFTWYLTTYIERIKEWRIADLGCGTGRLTQALAYLGASFIVSFDIDLESLKILKNFSIKANDFEKIDVVCGDVKMIPFRDMSFDVVIQNPPFGVQKRHADINFLKAAFKISRYIVFSLHKYSTLDFILEFAQRKNWTTKFIKALNVQLKPIFKFHKSRRYYVKVAILLFLRNQ